MKKTLLFMVNSTAWVPFTVNSKLRKKRRGILILDYVFLLNSLGLVILYEVF